jgi:MazG family protein
MSDERHTRQPLGELFSELVKTISELRRQCPWDREQTPEKLSRYLIEEAYEASDAILAGKPNAVSEELGDLFAQILFQTEIAQERGLFTLAEMLSQARAKLIRRHPHVYGAERLANAEEVLRRWDAIKHDERKQAGMESALGDGASGLPAIMRAEKLGQRARAAGLDWPELRAVLAKTREELDEAEAMLACGDFKRAGEELGDALLALANAPRFLDASAEQTLRCACDKFIARFTELERLADERRLTINQLSPQELDELWEEAKRRLVANRGRSEPAGSKDHFT